MYKIGICGLFGEGLDLVNGGQMAKTKELTDELIRVLGNSQVLKVDTYAWKEKPIKLSYSCLKLIKNCRNILILPSKNGVKVFLPLFVILNFAFRRKLHYAVVGGWLPEYLKDNKRLLKYVRRFDAIYVETKSMKKQLELMGLKNVYLMYNFKRIQVVSYNELSLNCVEPLKFCTFSRVSKSKGILDAIKAVGYVNNKLGKIFFTLDIYGPMEKGFESELETEIRKFPNCVAYKGCVPYGESVEVLKNYFALLFPTYYEGEGFPGTIIDAFSAGLPVIASNWRYNNEIVDSGRTGFIYDLVDGEYERGLIETLLFISKNPQKILQMKGACLVEAKKYDANAVMQIMIKQLS